MRVKPALPTKAILTNRRPDNYFLVENVAGSVIIRAARDNFSPRRKSFFVRHLAAEGYIPDRFEHLYEPGCDSFSTLRWIIDPTCMTPAINPRLQTNRFMIRLILGAFVLWIGLLFFAFFQSRDSRQRLRSQIGQQGQGIVLAFNPYHLSGRYDIAPTTLRQRRCVG